MANAKTAHLKSSFWDRLLVLISILRDSAELNIDLEGGGDRVQLNTTVHNDSPTLYAYYRTWTET